MAVQTAIVVVLLLSRRSLPDFYALLFGVLSMQAMQRLSWKTALCGSRCSPPHRAAADC